MTFSIFIPKKFTSWETEKSILINYPNSTLKFWISKKKVEFANKGVTITLHGYEDIRLFDYNKIFCNKRGGVVDSIKSKQLLKIKDKFV